MEKIYNLPNIYGTTCFFGKKCAICFIDEKGKTHLISKKNKYPIVRHNVFFVRGLEFFFVGLWQFFANLVQMQFAPSKIGYKMSQKLNVTTNQIMTFVLCMISIFVGVLLFGYLPIKISVALSGLNYNILFKKFLVALFKVMILYFTLMTLKLFRGFKQFYRFNASLNIDDNHQSHHKPTNFLNFIVFGFFINTIVVSLIGLNINAFFNPILNLIISIVVFSLCFEILLLIENSKIRNWCIITSWLVTEKPGKTEKYCATCAKYEVKQMQNKKTETISNASQLDFSVVYAEAKQKLESAGVYDKSDLDWLLCEVLDVSRSELRLQNKITKTKYKEIQNAIQKRANGCPITKIFGRTEFYGLEFKVTKDVLSPRMETELLVEQVLGNVSAKSEVLDVGTGSGVIAICVAKFSKAKVTAVDVSEKALGVAEQNANQNQTKVTFICSNLFENLKKGKKFDIIVSNPPYIKTEDINSLDIEVKNYDPILALDGGQSGFDFYEKIIKSAPNYLKTNGKIFFEVGKGQAVVVAKMLEENFKDIQIIKDYNKINRIVIAKLKNKGIKNVRTNRKNKEKI